MAKEGPCRTGNLPRLSFPSRLVARQPVDKAVRAQVRQRPRRCKSCSSSRHMPNKDGGGRARNSWHVVVLGEPEADVAEGLDVLCEIERDCQGLGRDRALRNRRKVENGIGIIRRLRSRHLQMVWRTDDFQRLSQ